MRGDACALAGSPDLGPVDLAYLDPPYNQHRYDSNYHVWETLVAWDAPAHYGVACKRDDLRDPTTRSAFNGRRTMPAALAEVVGARGAEVVVLSYNNESWLSYDELHELCSARGHVEVLAFDSARYVGARIGIHDPSGRKVGRSPTCATPSTWWWPATGSPGAGHGRGRGGRRASAPGSTARCPCRGLTDAGPTGAPPRPLTTWAWRPLRPNVGRPPCGRRRSRVAAGAATADPAPPGGRHEGS